MRRSILVFALSAAAVSAQELPRTPNVAAEPQAGPVARGSLSAVGGVLGYAGIGGTGAYPMFDVHAALGAGSGEVAFVALVGGGYVNPANGSGLGLLSLGAGAVFQGRVVTTVGFGAMNVIGYSSLWGPMMVLDFGVPLAGPFGMHLRLRASYFEGAVLLATGIGFGF